VVNVFLFPLMVYMLLKITVSITGGDVGSAEVSSLLYFNKDKMINVARVIISFHDDCCEYNARIFFSQLLDR